MLERRSFLTGLVAAVAAPAVVQASSLMPISSRLLKPMLVLPEWRFIYNLEWKVIELTNEDRSEMARAQTAAIEQAA